MKKEFEDIAAQNLAARTKLAKIIHELYAKVLEDDEGIKVINTKCGMVPISLISKHQGNISPSYWLPKEVKTMFLNILSENNRHIGNPTKLIEVMDNIVATGIITYKNHTQTIKPNILKALKEAWEG